jgi:hypothetical protein
LKTFVVYNKANPSGLYKPAAGFLLDHIRDDVVTSPLWDAHLKNRRAALQTHGRPLSRPETANGVLSCGGRRNIGNSNGSASASSAGVINGGSVVPAGDIALTVNAFLDMANRPDPNKDRTCPIVLITGHNVYSGIKTEPKKTRKKKGAKDNRSDAERARQRLVTSNNEKTKQVNFLNHRQRWNILDGSFNLAAMECSGECYKVSGMLIEKSVVRLVDYTWLLLLCGGQEVVASEVATDTGDGGAASATAAINICEGDEPASKVAADISDDVGAVGAAAVAANAALNVCVDDKPKYKLAIVVFEFEVLAQGVDMETHDGVWTYPEPDHFSRIMHEVAATAATEGEPLDSCIAQHAQFKDLQFPFCCDGSDKGCGDAHRQFGQCVTRSCPPESIPLEALVREYPFVTKLVSNMSNSEKRCCLYFYYHSTFFKMHGDGDRHRLPLCIELAVRLLYPNPKGTPYKGYMAE